MEVRHGRSVSTFGSLPSFLAFFVFFCPFFPFFAENTPNQIRWGILRYSRWRKRHSFVPGENTKKGKKLAHIVVQWGQKQILSRIPKIFIRYSFQEKFRFFRKGVVQWLSGQHKVGKWKERHSFIPGENTKKEKKS